MVNLFVFSNSYISRTIIYALEYLLGKSVGNIILLQENHQSSEKWNILGNSNIIMCENIDECVSRSTTILVIAYDNIPIKNINKIKRLASKNNRNLIIVNYTKNANDSVRNKIDDYVCYEEKPLVLILSCGEYTQTMYVELLLNKLLSEYNVTILQEFSEETSNIMQQLHSFGYLNEIVAQSFLTPQRDSNMIIKTMRGDFFTHSLKSIDFARSIYMIKPDYILLNVNARMGTDDNLKSFFYNKYGYKINFIIRSCYAPVMIRGEKPYALYIDAGLQNTDDSSFLENNLQTNTLAQDILSKIALPSKVTLVK